MIFLKDTKRILPILSNHSDEFKYPFTFVCALIDGIRKNKYIVNMFGFFLKKNFCDVWDNFFHTIAINLPMMILFIPGYFFCAKMAGLQGGAALGNLGFMIAVTICCMVWGIFYLAEGENAARISKYESPKYKIFLSQIVHCIKDGILLGLLVAFLILAVFISIPYYFKIWIPMDGSKGSLTGLFMMACVFWVVVIATLAIQWILPIRSLMHNKFRKCLKKSFIIFFDNPLFSLGVALVNLLNFIFSFVSFGILDGPATMGITLTNALRLRLYKYDWLEINPGLTKAQRKEVPWEELIAADKQTLGPRTLRSFLFTWKD